MQNGIAECRIRIAGMPEQIARRQTTEAKGILYAATKIANMEAENRNHLYFAVILSKTSWAFTTEFSVM